MTTNTVRILHAATRLLLVISLLAQSGESSLRGQDRNREELRSTFPRSNDKSHYSDITTHSIQPRAFTTNGFTTETAEGRDYVYSVFVETSHLHDRKTLPPRPTDNTPSPTQAPTSSNEDMGGDTSSPTQEPTSSNEDMGDNTSSPTQGPTSSNGETEPLSYEPGVFLEGKRSEDDLILLSNGLSAKPIAFVGEPVKLEGGGRSVQRFHKNPDAAAVFEVEDGRYLYVSNAENDDPGTNWNEGGVGVIEFNADGDVIGYRKIVSTTQENCGGGKTPWNSWISGEERDGGHCIQIDPFGEKPPVVLTALGELGKYESFAYDDQTDVPTFYSTRDDVAGIITRFTPDEAGLECYNQQADYDRWCTLYSGTLDYLYLTSEGGVEWTDDLKKANARSEEYHANCEGINVYNGMLYFTAKTEHLLYSVNLRTLEYDWAYTTTDRFENQPDQIVRIEGDDSGKLYFCEDGGHQPGLHVRDSNGRVYTALYADKNEFENAEETTGVAFSPDAMHLYVSFQHVGVIYDVTRDDKRSFKDEPLTVEYNTE